MLRLQNKGFCLIDGNKTVQKMCTWDNEAMAWSDKHVIFYILSIFGPVYFTDYREDKTQFLIMKYAVLQ